jgi:cell division protein FtsI (penicillin-binding protein 3)
MALEHVVSLGLGKTAGSKYTRVAGKSGTVQVKEQYGYGDEPVYEFQVSFCGYFPADKPKYSLIVSMNKIGYPASGGFMAGMVFHNIVEWMLLQKRK